MLTGTYSALELCRRAVLSQSLIMAADQICQVRRQLGHGHVNDRNLYQSRLIDAQSHPLFPFWLLPNQTIGTRVKLIILSNIVLIPISVFALDPHECQPIKYR